MRIPPGVSEQDFAAALGEFARAVGERWVFTAEEDVDLYRDSYSIFRDEPEEFRVSAAVAPDSVEQVQKVIRTANTYKIPIYTVSTGRNLGYGGSAPALSGSVVLDLKRMNRILEVNEKNAYALVEPGVTYFDLYRYIQEKGLKLWLDVPDPGWGSPIGNALDRGAGFTAAQYCNHFESHCGMEVVLANGEVVRTGMGALPGAKTWQQYKTGFGPWIDGIFSQSNFGVVTKMGFWLMPEPDAYLEGLVTFTRRDDLIPLVDVLNYLENTRVINGSVSDILSPLLGIAGPFYTARTGAWQGPIDPDVSALLAKPGGPTDQELEQLALRKGIPYWSLQVSFYGPEKTNAANWEFVKEKFSVIPGVKFEDRERYKLPLTPEQREKVHKPRFGIPSLMMFSAGTRASTDTPPTSGHLWFSTIIPRTGEAIFEANEVFADVSREFGVPVRFSLPILPWDRSFIFVFPFPVMDDQEFNKRTRQMVKRLIQKAAEHGWAEYRTAPAFQDAVMATYSYNNHALLRLHETLKDAVDPNGILSAGRYGIWPKHLRKA